MLKAIVPICVANYEAWDDRWTHAVQLKGVAMCGHNANHDETVQDMLCNA